MDAYINPITRAYVRTGTDLERDPANGLANAVYLRLMTPLGSYWANTALGSRLHELTSRAKAVSNVALLARQYAAAALQPIVDDGRAQTIDVQAQTQDMDDASKALVLIIQVVDAAGRQVVFKHHVRVA
jgi:phage gp46-like protein